MNNSLIIPEKLEKLLLSHWADFLNKTLLLRRVLEDARDSKLKFVKNDAAPTPQTKVTITKFQLLDNSKFEVWVEFTVPKDGGVAVGTHTYLMELNGSLTLIETYGVFFAT